MSEINENGVWKKIQAQIKTFNNTGLEIKLVNCSYENNDLINKFQKKLNSNYFIKNLPDDFFLYDFYYIRYGYSTIPFLGIIRKIKQQRKNKLIIEMPTYPYHKEFKSGFDQINKFIDNVMCRKLKKYADRITTYSKHESIYGIPTIKLRNGIECSLINIKHKKYLDNSTINLIAIANFCYWHGYDRLINGLSKYVSYGLKKNIIIHFVGDGPELIKYKRMVQQYGLSKYVIFYGILIGEELTKVINNVDIGVCSLGGHRKQIYLSSELKSREYLAHGLPILSSMKIDILPDNFKYCQYVSEDESFVDMRLVLQFYHDLMEDNKNMSYEIRNFAEKNCDMAITMKPIINYIYYE